jgi:hypothetical protein
MSSDLLGPLQIGLQYGQMIIALSAITKSGASYRVEAIDNSSS